MTNEQTEFFTTETLARYLGVSIKFIHKHRQQLPGRCRAGRIWLYRKCEIEKKILSGELLLSTK